MTLTVAFIIGCVCVLFQGFFSGSEIAMVSADKARLRRLATEGDRGAQLCEIFLERPEVLLSTTLIGTNLAMATFAVAVALAMLGEAEGVYAELVTIAMVTPLTLIMGELVPKTLFQQHADSLVTRIVYPLRIASIILRPAVWVTSGFASVMSRLLRMETRRAFITRDELVLLIEAETEGATDITEEEREMIANVFELSEATAEEVMVPLSEVTAVPQNMTVAEAALVIADKQHSRMPVYQTRVDDIVGVLHVFDVLQAGPEGTAREVHDIARSPTYVPEHKPADELLVELQRTGNTMAVVVDEYGGAVGIVTIEDLLEEVVGEIDDEYDYDESAIRHEGGHTWRVLARTSVERINSELGIGLPESDDYESIAGFVLDRLHRIPESGVVVKLDNVSIRITAASDRAVEEVQITKTRK